MVLYNDKKTYKEPWVCFEYFETSNIITTSGELGKGDDVIEDPDAVITDSAGHQYYLDENGDIMDPNDVNAVY